MLRQKKKLHEPLNTLAIVICRKYRDYLSLSSVIPINFKLNQLTKPPEIFQRRFSWN